MNDSSCTVSSTPSCTASSTPKHTIRSNNLGYIYNPRSGVVVDIYANHQQFHHHNQQQHQQQQTNSVYQWVYESIVFDWFYPFSCKLSVMIKTSFLYYITTTIVSFTLHETQYRMLHFTQTLQYYVRNQYSIYTLVIQHIIENFIFVPMMIGIIFFLIEFYHGDKLLAFLMLSLIWICEAYTVVRYVITLEEYKYMFVVAFFFLSVCFMILIFPFFFW